MLQTSTSFVITQKYAAEESNQNYQGLTTGAYV